MKKSKPFLQRTVIEVKEDITVDNIIFFVFLMFITSFLIIESSDRITTIIRGSYMEVNTSNKIGSVIFSQEIMSILNEKFKQEGFREYQACLGLEENKVTIISFPPVQQTITITDYYFENSVTGNCVEYQGHIHSHPNNTTRSHEPSDT